MTKKKTPRASARGKKTRIRGSASQSTHFPSEERATEENHEQSGEGAVVRRVISREQESFCMK